jgi:REP-associated tyrosine transposase
MRTQGSGEYPVCWDYWVYCPCDEKTFFICLYYLSNNPVKHGFVTDLRCYSYSSLKTLGRDELAQQLKVDLEYKYLCLEAV